LFTRSITLFAENTLRAAECAPLIHYNNNNNNNNRANEPAIFMRRARNLIAIPISLKLTTMKLREKERERERRRGGSSAENRSRRRGRDLVSPRSRELCNYGKICWSIGATMRVMHRRVHLLPRGSNRRNNNGGFLLSYYNNRRSSSRDRRRLREIERVIGRFIVRLPYRDARDVPTTTRSLADDLTAAAYDFPTRN